MTTTTDGQESLERAIAGALKATIRDHGPITADKVGSAAKRVAGNLKNARLGGMAAALGRKGGLARKEAGTDFARLGKKGGRAGRGVKRPHSEAARRRSLARRLLRAAGDAEMIPAKKMVVLAAARPELHKEMPLQNAADALGVTLELKDVFAEERTV